MTAFNTYRDREEDAVYVSMMQDFALELPDMTEYYYAYSDEAHYMNEDDYAKSFRIAYPKALDGFHINPIAGKSMFDYFFYTLGFYPSEENLAKAREYFDKQH